MIQVFCARAVLVDESELGRRMTEVKSPYVSLARLEEMLAEGWEVEPPVYTRPRWRSTWKRQRKSAYHFVLWREKHVHLVSIPEGPEIRQFLVDHKLPVDHI